MARKRNEAGHDGAEQRPRRRRGKLALLLLLAGGVAYLLRQSQQRARLDEGVWHEAPAGTASEPPSKA